MSETIKPTEAEKEDLAFIHSNGARLDHSPLLQQFELFAKDGTRLAHYEENTGARDQIAHYAATVLRIHLARKEKTKR